MDRLCTDVLECVRAPDLKPFAKLNLNSHC